MQHDSKGVIAQQRGNPTDMRGMSAPPVWGTRDYGRRVCKDNAPPDFGLFPRVPLSAAPGHWRPHPAASARAGRTAAPPPSRKPNIFLHAAASSVSTSVRRWPAPQPGVKERRNAADEPADRARSPPPGRNYAGASTLTKSTLEVPRINGTPRARAPKSSDTHRATPCARSARIRVSARAILVLNLPQSP